MFPSTVKSIKLYIYEELANTYAMFLYVVELFIYCNKTIKIPREKGDTYL